MIGSFIRKFPSNNKGILSLSDASTDPTYKNILISNEKLVWWLHVWEDVTVIGNEDDCFIFSENGFGFSSCGWANDSCVNIKHVIRWRFHSSPFTIRFTECRSFQCGRSEVGYNV